MRIEDEGNVIFAHREVKFWNKKTTIYGQTMRSGINYWHGTCLKAVWVRAKTFVLCGFPLLVAWVFLYQNQLCKPNAFDVLDRSLRTTAFE